MATETEFEGWAILELMGHRRLAGYVTQVELAGHGMLRLDVPANDTPQPEPAISELAPWDVQATQFYSPAALYCLTPTTEEIARRLAASSRPAPAQRWELAPPAAPAAPAAPDDRVEVDPWDVDSPDDPDDELEEATR